MLNLQFVKKALRQLLAGAGLEVRRIGNTPTWMGCLAMLKTQGFRPLTVFDVGVATGTPVLYDALPDAHFVLVDPTRESLPYMQAIAQWLDAEVHNLAMGDQDGEMEIEVRPENIAGSSLFEEVGLLSGTTRYKVPVRRFDHLVGQFARPALCKIDVQGAEMMVLRGMGDRIKEIDALIVEVSTIATVRDAPEMYEVMAFLKQRGLVVFDIVETTRRPLDGALAQVDLLFVREDAALRADKRWQR